MLTSDELLTVLTAVANPHRLRIVAEDRTYNCHAHGRGIEQLPEYQQRVAKERNSALVQGTLMTELIERGELQLVEGESYGPGNIVIYFKDGRPTHTARVVEKDGLDTTECQL